MNSKVYPDWVQAQRIRGTVVKKKGDVYYLYKRTSKRVPGKKYPQAVDSYIGIITPEGVIKTGNIKVSSSDIEVAEYGFSQAVLHLCPADWKKAVGNQWMDVLKTIIVKWSPESYLKDSIGSPVSPHSAINAQAGSLIRRVEKETGKKIPEAIEPLKTIYLVTFGKKKLLSRIHKDQQEVLDSLGIPLEVK